MTNDCVPGRLAAAALMHDPLWKPQHLGRPIPESPHAVSVCLPRWQDNIAYEEGEARVLDRLRSGYPRFVYSPLCRDLFETARRQWARDGEDSIVLATEQAADRCARLLTNLTRRVPRVDVLELHGAYAVTFAMADADVAKAIWQHGGEGISSRQALACLTGEPAVDGSAACEALRYRIATLAGVPSQHVSLHATGMSAFFAVYRALTSLIPGRQTVQFGFPYVDSLKVQERFGPGAVFFPRGDDDDLRKLEQLLESQPIAGLFTEFPSNPLLNCPDLERLAALARKYHVPLVVDDTLSGFANVDLLPAADVVVTSLTKLFSGVGDVTAGSVVVNPHSRFATELTGRLRNDEFLWCEDAVVLEQNSRDYVERAAKTAIHAEQLAERLRRHAAVSAVHYPKFTSPSRYDAFRRPGGGYGNLLSIDLKHADRNAPPVFDALRVCKGPNLGTDYTLVCPYTLLAHYRELEVVERLGVSRSLLRISAGLEPPDDIINRFEEALAEAR